MENEELELYSAAVSAVDVIAIVIKNRRKNRGRRRRPKVWVSSIFQRRYQRGTTYILLARIGALPQR
jgi:hypothetical protein